MKISNNKYNFYGTQKDMHTFFRHMNLTGEENVILKCTGGSFTIWQIYSGPGFVIISYFVLLLYSSWFKEGDYSVIVIVTFLHEI